MRPHDSPRLRACRRLTHRGYEHAALLEYLDGSGGIDEVDVKVSGDDETAADVLRLSERLQHTCTLCKFITAQSPKLLGLFVVKHLHTTPFRQFCINTFSA